MHQLLQVVRANAAHLLVSALMALLCAWFAYRHINAFDRTGDWTYLLISFSESVIATFFVLRKMPVSVSKSVFDWLIAIIGTFAPLFLAPASWGVLAAAKIAMPIALFFQILGVFSLNRSFALVAATREIKTGGMYRFIRHPLYASYLIMFTGYVLANTSSRNLFIYAVTICCLFVRMLREERHLAVDPLYRQYMERVRYRVVPLMF